jgi:hypothetical protein
MRERIMKGCVVASVAVMSVLVSAAVAVAQTTTTVDPNDPTNGAAEDLGTHTTTWVSAHGAPLIVALLGLGLIIGLLIKFGKRGKSAV